LHAVSKSPRVSRGNERLFDISEKGLAVHRAVEDHGRSDPVVTQLGREGDGFPMAMWHGGGIARLWAHDRKGAPS
jgi:hypothetical protein